MAGDIAARYAAHDPILMDVEGEHAALWYELKLALPPDAEDQIVSLYDYRKRYGYGSWRTSRRTWTARTGYGCRTGARNGRSMTCSTCWRRRASSGPAR